MRNAFLSMGLLLTLLFESGVGSVTAPGNVKTSSEEAR